MTWSSQRQLQPRIHQRDQRDTHITLDWPDERLQDGPPLLIGVKHQALAVKQENIVEHESEVSSWYKVPSRGSRALRFCRLT